MGQWNFVNPPLLPFVCGHCFVFSNWGCEMLSGYNWLSVNHDFWDVFWFAEVVHVFTNEPDPCDTCLDPSFCICRCNGCIIARFMNNQISMQRGVELQGFQQPGSDERDQTWLCGNQWMGSTHSDCVFAHLWFGITRDIFTSDLESVEWRVHTTVRLCQIFKYPREIISPSFER